MQMCAHASCDPLISHWWFKLEYPNRSYELAIEVDREFSVGDELRFFGQLWRVKQVLPYGVPEAMPRIVFARVDEPLP